MLSVDIYNIASDNKWLFTIFQSKNPLKNIVKAPIPNFTIKQVVVMCLSNVSPFTPDPKHGTKTKTFKDAYPAFLESFLSLLLQHKDCCGVHYECRRPGNGTLTDHYAKGPFAAKLTLYGCYRCDTRCIQQAKH